MDNPFPALRLQINQHKVDALETRSAVPNPERQMFWDGYLEGLNWVLNQVTEVEAAIAIEKLIQDLPETDHPNEGEMS